MQQSLDKSICSMVSRTRTYCFCWSSSKHTVRPFEANREDHVCRSKTGVKQQLAIFLKGSWSYCIGCKMLEHDFDVFIQASDWRACIGHTGWHDKGVEGLLHFAVLKITKTEVVTKMYLCFEISGRTACFLQRRESNRALPWRASGSRRTETWSLPGWGAGCSVESCAAGRTAGRWKPLCCLKDTCW